MLPTIDESFSVTRYLPISNLMAPSLSFESSPEAYSSGVMAPSKWNIFAFLALEEKRPKIASPNLSPKPLEESLILLNNPSPINPVYFLTISRPFFVWLLWIPRAYFFVPIFIKVELCSPPYEARPSGILSPRSKIRLNAITALTAQSTLPPGFIIPWATRPFLLLSHSLTKRLRESSNSSPRGVSFVGVRTWA